MKTQYPACVMPRPVRGPHEDRDQFESRLSVYLSELEVAHAKAHNLEGKQAQRRADALLRRIDKEK